eukprot:6119026-Pyramimonas_sp.AAC.1
MMYTSKAGSVIVRKAHASPSSGLCSSLRACSQDTLARHEWRGSCPRLSAFNPAIFLILGATSSMISWIVFQTSSLTFGPLRSRHDLLHPHLTLTSPWGISIRHYLRSRGSRGRLSIGGRAGAP